jgi:signal transduction histidine kinase
MKSSKPEGTGLGLPIARRIAEAHGGELRITSAPGAGTSVFVTLPREHPVDGERA